MSGAANRFSEAGGPDGGGGLGSLADPVHSAQCIPATDGSPTANASHGTNVFRILHVEDDPLIARVMREVLVGSEHPRFEVQNAGTLQEGLAWLAAHPVDVVLLDLNLPDSQGMATVGQVRSQFHKVPIVVLSGHDDERFALAALKQGAQDYLVKHAIIPELIVRTVRHAMERKRAEDELAHERDLLHALLNNIPDRIYFKDAASRFVRVSRALAERFRLDSPELAVGRSDFDFHPALDAQAFYDDEQRLLRTGEALVNKVERQTAEGTERWASVTKVPMRDRHGRIVGLIGISRDVTEMRQANQQLQTANEELQQANAALREAQLQLMHAERLQSVGRLAAGVAHEVKNPLAVLRMGVDFFLNTPLPAERAEVAGIVLGDMETAIHRADRIIMGLLDFSAPAELDFQPMNVEELLDRACTLVRHEVTAHGFVVERQPADRAACARLDAQKIEQVLVNLFTNAFHAMADGGRLTLRTIRRQIAPEESHREAGSRAGARFRPGDEVVEIQVDDTGTGIPADALDKIFAPFFTTKETGKGTGLGLSVARKITELNGGALTINNRPEGGVRATLLFPACQPSI